MTDAETHPYQQQVVNLFSKAWGRCLGPDQPDPSIPAKALAQHIAEANDPSPGVYIWSTILAIHQYASICPQSLDFILLAYESACNQFPDTVTNEYGHGPAAGLQQLKWWLVEEGDGFQGVLLPPRSIGSVEAGDRSNLRFKDSDLDRDLDAVLWQIEDWRGARTSWIIAAAMQARCFSLDIIRVNQGSQVEALIESGLNRGQRRWSKVGFIGSCIMMRGCGKSLLDQLGSEMKQGKLDSWKSCLETYLRHDEEATPGIDFGVTYHASVSLFSITTSRKAGLKLTVLSLHLTTFEKGRETRPAVRSSHLKRG